MASAISSVTAAVCLARKLTRITSGFFGFAPESLQLVVQCLDGDTQNLCGSGLVVACVDEGEFNKPALGFVDGHPGCEPHRLNRRGRRSRQITGQVIGFDELTR